MPDNYKADVRNRSRSQIPRNDRHLVTSKPLLSKTLLSEALLSEDQSSEGFSSEAVPSNNILLSPFIFSVSMVCAS